MCGIGGIIWRGDENRQEIAGQALTSMKHRGPDDAAYYLDDFIGLMHTRLSIVDDAGGKQPFCIAGRDEILVYNGEIFNYDDLKKMLDARGVILRSHSDTELLFHLIVSFGKKILPKINGQFAFCFYDPNGRSLLLARDAFGEKPLFYTEHNGQFAFASEVKTILNLTPFEPQLCSKQLNSLQRYWATLPGQSVFKGIAQIPAGHLMEYKNGKMDLSCYLAPLDGSQVADGEKIEPLMSNAVSRRLRSDVTVGLMLSGGLDSSIIGEEMVAANSATSLKTFSVAFPNEQFDERKYQEIMVDHLSSDHEVVEMNEAAMCDTFSDAVYAAEMPSPRMAFTAIYALHQKVRQQGIKVLLSGEGADEMFMGYDIFTEVYIKDQIRKGRSFEELQGVISQVNAFMPNDENYHRLVRLKYSNYRALTDDESWNSSHSQRRHLGARSLRFSNNNKDDALAVDDDWHSFFQSKYTEFSSDSEYRRAQKLETETLMSGHLLCTQGDRVSMANSVETRLPFLDPTLAAFSMVQDTEKAFFSGKSEKEILKNAYIGRLPQKILDRKKFPFRAPDSLSFLSSDKGREFVAGHLDAIGELEEVFDVEKFRQFFDGCLKKGANSPRDNFAFVFGLTTLSLQTVMKRALSTVSKNFPQQKIKQVFKTDFGAVFRVINWSAI